MRLMELRCFCLRIGLFSVYFETHSWMPIVG
jgi:hypothetical protein